MKKGGCVSIFKAKGLGIAPVTLNSVKSPSADWTMARRATLIWLVVSVPVLSEQITVVQPSVSTEGRLRSTAG